MLKTDPGYVSQLIGLTSPQRGPKYSGSKRQKFNSCWEVHRWAECLEQTHSAAAQGDLDIRAPGSSPILRGSPHLWFKGAVAAAVLSHTVGSGEWSTSPFLYKEYITDVAHITSIHIPVAGN